jgi:hypothetical protein
MNMLKEFAIEAAGRMRKAAAGAVQPICPLHDQLHPCCTQLFGTRKHIPDTIARRMQLVTCCREATRGRSRGSHGVPAGAHL